MTANDDRERELFEACLGVAPEERGAFLDQACGGQDDLAARVRRLLAAHEASRGFSRGVGAVAGLDPQQIGPYRIFERIGEGGMGVVYAAEQSEPFRRRVAIKVIKLGMDTREVVARFEAERQAMAMMDHPSVAKALDAGVTDQGRPYFVMELVKGLSLTEYCSRNKLPLRDRLRLFAEVCAAIRHAHQKGIIHRDLKPSNILVAVQDGRPIPKVIDFGVAKATAARLTERTLFTEQGRLIGTPEYMSPEQAEMSGLDVDTRTDVYSLGVVLYELLTGTLPFDTKTLRAGGYAEILRIVREVDPPRPSTRLLELARAEGAPRAVAGPARSVRDELDWIVMRAMEKDRTRRYPTVNALGEDIERYLTDRPVLAGPPSVVYGMRKFVERHRYVAALIGLTALSAVLGVTGLAIGLIRARESEALAVRRAETAHAAAGFLERVLFQADPEFGGGSLSLLQVMDSAGRSIAEELGPYPEVEASVRESLGVAYRRRSMFAEAEPHLVRSLEIRRQQFGEHSLEAARAYIAMADLRFEYEGNIDDSLALLRRALDCYETCDLAGSAAEAWLQLDLGIVNLAGDRLAAAERAFGRCRELLSVHRGAHHPDVSRPVRGLALVALARDDLAQAELLAREAVALSRGEDAEYIGARAQIVLAQVLLAEDRFDDASEQLDRTGDRFSDTVGGRHIRIAERFAALGELHLRQREFETAERISSRCEAMRRELLHEEHWAILEARLLQLRARIGLGRVESVEPELLEVEAAAAERLGPDHPLVIQVTRARVELATVIDDGEAREVGAERVADLRGRRAERLRSESGR